MNYLVVSYADGKSTVEFTTDKLANARMFVLARIRGVRGSYFIMRDVPA